MLPAQTPTQAPPTLPTAATPISNPVLPPAIPHPAADKVIAAFLTGQDTTVAEIAERCALSLQTVSLILESDYACETIDLIERLAYRSAQVIAAELRTEALYATRRIAQTATNLETARKAAASLLRLTPFPATGGGGPVEAQPQPGGGVPTTLKPLSLNHELAAAAREEKHAAIDARRARAARLKAESAACSEAIRTLRLTFTHDPRAQDPRADSPAAAPAPGPSAPPPEATRARPGPQPAAASATPSFDTTDN